MPGKTKLTSIDEDILKEVANIGAGNAAASMAKLLKYSVTISTSMIKIITITQLPEIVGYKEIPAVGSHMKLMGDLNGLGVVYMLQEDALSFADIMREENIGTTKVLTEEYRSGLNEMALILISSYSNALKILSGLSVFPSAPDLFFSRTDQIAKFIEKKTNEFEERDRLICLNTQLIQREHKLQAFILFFIEYFSYQRLITLLKQKTNQG